MPEPIRTSDPRGYNTGNVPPSYGPEDGKVYGDASHREADDEITTVSKICGECRRTKPQRTDSAVGVPRMVLCPAPRRRLRNPGKLTTKKPTISTDKVK